MPAQTDWRYCPKCHLVRSRCRSRVGRHSPTRLARGDSKPGLPHRLMAGLAQCEQVCVCSGQSRSNELRHAAYSEKAEAPARWSIDLSPNAHGLSLHGSSPRVRQHPPADEAAACRQPHTISPELIRRPH
jgi:hypothetical protein